MDKMWFKARRLISMLLVFAMLASVMPAQAFADEGTEAGAVSTTSETVTEGESAAAEAEAAAQKAAEDAAAQKAAEEAAAQKAAEEAAAQKAAEEAAAQKAAEEAAAQKAAEEAAAQKAAEEAAAQKAAEEAAAQKAAEEAAAQKAAEEAAAQKAAEEAAAEKTGTTEPAAETEEPVEGKVPAEELPAEENALPDENTEKPVTEEEPAEAPAEEPVLVSYTVQYLDKATEAAVAEETAGEAAVGETIAIEAPAVEGYTLCADQPTELVLAADTENTAVLYYEAEVTMPAQTLSAAAADGATVTIVAPEGALPEGTTVQIVKMATVPEVPGVEYTEAVAYDVTLWKDGAEVQPAVAVSVTLSNVPLDVAPEDMAVYHKADDGTVDEGSVKADKSADFSLDSFCPFVVCNTGESADTTESDEAPEAALLTNHWGGHGNAYHDVYEDLYVGETYTIYDWYATSCEITDGNGNVSLDKTGYNTWKVTGRNDGGAIVRVIRTRGFWPYTWKEIVDYHFNVTEKDTSGTTQTVYLYVKTEGTVPEGVKPNQSDWYTIGKIEVQGLPDITTQTPEINIYDQYSTQIAEGLKNINRYEPNAGIDISNVQWHTLKRVTNGADDYVPDGNTWHLDGYITVTPESYVTITYTDGVDGEEIFQDEVYVVLKGTATPAYSKGTPTRDGYLFTSWTPEPSGTADQTITYTAQWVKNTVNVTYDDGVDDNSVTNMPDNATNVPTGSYTVSQTVPSRTGYRFTGWKVNGTETVVQPGNEIVLRDDTTLTAQWQAVYKVTYDANAGTDVVEGLPAPATNVPNGPFTPDAGRGMSRYGYTFLGWSTNPEATVPEASFTVNGADLVLYAVWRDDSAVIQFETNGGTEIDPMTGIAGQAITDTTIPTTTKDGYTLVGWYTDAEFTGDPVTQLPDTFPAGTTTYYAKWDINYTIVHIYYNRDEGEVGRTTETDKHAAVGSVISLTEDMKKTEYQDQNYVYRDDNGPITLADDGTNTLNVYYDIDELGPNSDTNDPDGTADKDQVVFTYQVASEYQGKGTVSKTREVMEKKTEAGVGPSGATAAAVDGSQVAFDYWARSTDASKDYNADMSDFVATTYADDTTFTAYFADDKKGFDGEEPDGTPDKYQVLITVKDVTCDYTGEKQSGLKADAGNLTVATLDGGTLPAGYAVQVSDYMEYTAIDAGTYSGVADAATAVVTDGQGNPVLLYKCKVVAGKLNIRKVQAIIAINDAYKTEGTSDPAFTAKVTGTVNGETLDYTIFRTDLSEAVGTYKLDATFKAEEGVNKNYNITVELGTFEIFADQKGSQDGGPDSIPDEFQTIFQYVSAGNGTVSGSVYEVHTAENWKDNWKTATKPMVHPDASVDVTPATGYTFSNFTGSDGKTYASQDAIRTLETDQDMIFTAHFTLVNNLSYTVRYLEDNTARELASPKTVGGQTLGTSVTEYALDIAGYSLMSNANPQTITIGTGENIITFYYRAIGPATEPTVTPTENPTPLVLPTTPATPTTPTAPTTPAGPTVTAAPEEEVEAPAEEEEVPEEQTPLAPEAGEEESIGEAQTPLAGGDAAWALLNLILTILTVLGSVILLVGYLGKKRKEDEEGNEEYTVKKHGGWRLASLIPAIGAIIAFILTEDMSLPMVFVDRWTLLMVIIAVIQIVVAVLSLKDKQEPDEDDAANA